MFTDEEYQTLFNLVEYAWKDIWPEDEPLYDQVYKKLEKVVEINSQVE